MCVADSSIEESSILLLPEEIQRTFSEVGQDVHRAICDHARDAALQLRDSEECTK